MCAVQAVLAAVAALKSRAVTSQEKLIMMNIADKCAFMLICSCVVFCSICLFVISISSLLKQKTNQQLSCNSDEITAKRVEKLSRISPM